MENSASYEGSCHCGQVKYTVRISPPISEQTVMQCNCSICYINGYLMIYPKTADVTFHHADDAVKEYRFASKNVPHYFCTNCGTSVYGKADIPEKRHIMAVNVRTLSGIDLKTLKIHEHDGRGDAKV
ncbi:DUF636 domain protein [Penicillium brasilianum]|uniref:DUF636 domain protein n=1 Tax=Penicillium brasilianum TaxID=104259 RepID=A0A1S9RMD6_PENBI|nr:DUF636 domain protein [Penicillium brasilianum]